MVTNRLILWHLKRSFTLYGYFLTRGIRAHRLIREIDAWFVGCPDIYAFEALAEQAHKREADAEAPPLVHILGGSTYGAFEDLDEMRVWIMGLVRGLDLSVALVALHLGLHGRCDFHILAPNVTAAGIPLYNEHLREKARALARALTTELNERRLRDGLLPIGNLTPAGEVYFLEPLPEMVEPPRLALNPPSPAPEPATTGPAVPVTAAKVPPAPPTPAPDVLPAVEVPTECHVQERAVPSSAIPVGPVPSPAEPESQKADLPAASPAKTDPASERSRAEPPYREFLPEGRPDESAAQRAREKEASEAAAKKRAEDELFERWRTRLRLFLAARQRGLADRIEMRKRAKEWLAEPVTHHPEIQGFHRLIESELALQEAAERKAAAQRQEEQRLKMWRDRKKRLEIAIEGIGIAFAPSPVWSEAKKWLSEPIPDIPEFAGLRSLIEKYVVGEANPEDAVWEARTRCLHQAARGDAKAQETIRINSERWLAEPNPRSLASQEFRATLAIYHRPPPEKERGLDYP